MGGMHYIGVDRTLYLVGKVDLLVKMKEVQSVVRNCIKYQLTDPATSIHDPGEIEITNYQTKLAVDITHQHGSAYLSMINCRPG